MLVTGATGFIGSHVARHCLQLGHEVIAVDDLSGGLLRQRASIVATDGTVSEGPDPETKGAVGGFSIIEVPSREEALAWAARIARGCRCAADTGR